MDIWQRLGIQPTTDKKEIRKAFAGKSKLCHPEDNPEEFKLLRKAYKAAIYAAESWEKIAGGEKRETEMQEEELIFSESFDDMTSEKTGGISEEELDFSGISRDEDNSTADELEDLDFGSLFHSEPVQEKLSRQGELLIEEAESNFNIKPERLEIYAWKKYFKKPEYKSEINRRTFMLEFLNLLNSTKILPGVWERTISKELKLRSHEWNGTPLGNYVDGLRYEKSRIYDIELQEEEEKKEQEAKKTGKAWIQGELFGSVPQFKLIYPVFFVSLFLVVLLIMKLVIAGISGKENELIENALQSEESSEIDLFYNSESEEPEEVKTRLTEVLPLTGEEFMELRKEQSVVDSIYFHLRTGRDYVPESDREKQFKLTKEGYEALVEMESGLKPSEEIELINEIKAFSVVEPKIVEEKLIPDIYWGLTQQQMPLEAMQYAMILGIDRDRQLELRQLYKESGGDALMEELSEYRYFWEYITDIDRMEFVQRDGILTLEQTRY